MMVVLAEAEVNAAHDRLVPMRGGIGECRRRRVVRHAWDRDRQIEVGPCRRARQGCGTQARSGDSGYRKTPEPPSHPSTEHRPVLRSCRQGAASEEHPGASFSTTFQLFARVTSCSGAEHAITRPNENPGQAGVPVTRSYQEITGTY